jgi:hypothetical protein
MSKPARAFLLFFSAFSAILQLFNSAAGQDIRIAVIVRANEPAYAEVEGRFAAASNTKDSRNFSFVRRVVGADDLASRISEVKLFGEDGTEITFKKLIDGEFLADEPISGWRYRIDLGPRKIQAAAAHASWIADGNGILMLDDLLPLALGNNAKIRLEVPDGWQLLGSESVDSPGELSGSDIRSQVIPIGKSWRVRKVDSAAFGIQLVVSGEWLFTEDEAAAMAAEIGREYAKIFGGAPRENAHIVIARFPNKVSPGLWEAETRGKTVTMISSDMNFKTQSLQRLHEQLRHELFHLWIPNGVNLRGNYDWFYEGFALYQSLKTAVRINRIRFEDFLDTLSRAYDIDTAQTKRLSLIEASQNRWSGADTQVYTRGIIVAFLTDITLLDKSRGKRSAEDLVREIYQEHRPPAAETDGNSAILAATQKNTELVPLIDKYVKNSGRIEWTPELALAGIEATGEGRHISLKVREKPSGRQRALLDKLGYNSWRKLAGNPK